MCRICHIVIIQHATAYKACSPDRSYGKSYICFLKNKVFEMWWWEFSHLKISNMASWKGKNYLSWYGDMESVFYSCTQLLSSMLTSDKLCGLFCVLEEARGYRQTGLWAMQSQKPSPCQSSLTKTLNKDLTQHGKYERQKQAEKVRQADRHIYSDT